MKKFISTLLFIFLYTGVSFADDRLALMYNILPDDSKNSVIDKKSYDDFNSNYQDFIDPYYGKYHHFSESEQPLMWLSHPLILGK